MEQVFWIIDPKIEERHYTTGFPSLSVAAAKLGHIVNYINYDSINNKLDYIPTDLNRPSIAHGTIQFINKLIREHGQNLTPLVYFSDTTKLYHLFATPLKEYMLNSDYVILPFQEFVDKMWENPVFVKPLSGLKDFTGLVIKPEEFNHEISSLKQIQRISPETLCVVSSAKDILSEFRYLICNKKVVDGSEYRWDNVLDVRTDTLPECDKLANVIANLEWQADIVYICDIAMTKYGPKVIELNSFSSSGLYAMDTFKIVEAVAECVLLEHKGEI